MTRLTAALPDAASEPKSAATFLVGVFPGEGVGPEVIAVTLDVLNTLMSVTNRRIEIRMGGAIGSDARRLTGKSFSDEAIDFCESIFASHGVLLCGPGGSRFVYDLRQRFDLFCKFTPLAPLHELRDAGVLRPDHLGKVDIIAVRENISGLYFGQWGRGTDEKGHSNAYHSFEYTREQVDRILGVAARLATSRRGKLTLVIKREGIPAISDLWIESLDRVRQEIPVAAEILDIDNAVYQLIANPLAFDVFVSSNMFGDILADCGSLLLGSRGMSYSGNFSSDGRAAYQTGHGAGFDIAGTNTANPIGQILSLAMMLQESFHWSAEADAIRSSVAITLGKGFRTRDIAGLDSTVLGTREFGARICETLYEHLTGRESCIQH